MNFKNGCALTTVVVKKCKMMVNQGIRQAGYSALENLPFHWTLAFVTPNNYDWVFDQLGCKLMRCGRKKVAIELEY